MLSFCVFKAGRNFSAKVFLQSVWHFSKVYPFSYFDLVIVLHNGAFHSRNLKYIVPLNTGLNIHISPGAYEILTFSGILIDSGVGV